MCAGAWRLNTERVGRGRYIMRGNRVGTIKFPRPIVSDRLTAQPLTHHIRPKNPQTGSLVEAVLLFQ